MKEATRACFSLDVPTQKIVNDIALIKLPRPAELNAMVQPVCLPIGTSNF
jgi:hypothetical protein